MNDKTGNKKACKYAYGEMQNKEGIHAPQPGYLSVQCCKLEGWYASGHGIETGPGIE